MSTNERQHRLEVQCPDGIPYNAKILLDGKPLNGVTRVAVDLTLTHLVVARIEMYVDLGVDMRVQERVFERVTVEPSDTP